MDLNYSDEDYEDSEENDIIIHCYCEGHCPTGEDQGICQVTFGGKCFTAVEAEIDDFGYEVPVYSYGCLGTRQMSMMQCKADLVPHLKSKSIKCCDSGDFCNKDLVPTYEEKTAIVNPPNLPLMMAMSSLISCFVLIVIILIGFFIVYKTKQKEDNKPVEGVNNNETTEEVAEEPVMAKNLAELIEQSCCSGSGLPMMVQRTIAKQIEMGIPIGKGRFGEVWLGKWREEKVAVKVFLSTEEKSWRRETEVYQTVLMRHENILGFVAADIKGSGGWTQLLLITDYHERGSLYDFLHGHTLNPDSLLDMCMSIVRGLAHLHTEIFGIHGKPAIAHRDLKSKNILVKKNGECCLADFGLAVKFQTYANNLDVPSTERSGTKRYMSPEILDGRINLQNFDAHKAADMYACGLVFWEMANRCRIEGYPVPDYEPPFFGDIPSDPSFDQMRDVVCVKKVRPDIPDHWNEVEVLQTLSKTIQELWHDNAAVRLTALRVKKTLNKCCQEVAIDIE